MRDSLPEPEVTRPEPAGYFLAAGEGSGLLPWQHVSELLSAAKNYWVATSGASNRPHAMPVWGVWNGRELVFSTSPISRKARNLIENPWVAVHLENGDRVVVMEGHAREVREKDALRNFLEAYNPKYAWDFQLAQVEQGGVFAVQPRKVFAWLDGIGEGFSGTGTRWVFPV